MKSVLEKFAADPDVKRAISRIPRLAPNAPSDQKQRLQQKANQRVGLPVATPEDSTKGILARLVLLEEENRQLVEKVKEQRREIEAFRKTIVANAAFSESDICEVMRQAGRTK